MNTLAQQGSEAERFYAGAYARINRAMLAFGVFGAMPLFWLFGVPLGSGYLLGAALSFLNVYWLRNLIARFADFAARKPDSGGRTGRMSALFLLRYALVGMGAYAIFLVSPYMLYGFFAGLALPVAGIFFEAVVEVVHALQHH